LRARRMRGWISKMCARKQRKTVSLLPVEAVEKPTATQTNYRAWATDVVRQELHKAGWRLADLLQKIL
jgi:hypothetical protein